MSHFTSIRTEVRDLEALNDACVEMGLRLLKGTPCRGNPPKNQWHCRLEELQTLELSLCEQRFHSELSELSD